MLIDWFTIVAQVINFLILVWLLKRFLYQPILDAIDAREKRIAEELADADDKKAEARQERNEYQVKNEEFDRQRATLLMQAQEDANTERKRMLDTARQEADYLSARRHEALQSEQQTLNDALTRQTREEVFAIARKTLADLAGDTLEARMTEAFILRLHELNEADSSAFKSAFKANGNPLLLRSAFPLSSEHISSITSAVRHILGAESTLKYETIPTLIAGIELNANGYKIVWSIDGYLTSLEKRVNTLLKSAQKTETKN